jgi:hypothetical protein
MEFATNTKPKSQFQNLTDSGSWELETTYSRRLYLRWQGVWAGKHQSWRIAQVNRSGQIFSLNIQDDSSGIRRRLLFDFQNKPEMQFARDRLHRFLSEIQNK